MQPQKITRILYLIFLVSGISGLIYETVWLRVLSRILGSTVQASSITISAFMLGLTLGSFYIGKFSVKVKNKILFYAFLEAGIAVTAFTIFMMLERMVPVYRFLFEIAGDNMLLYRFLQATVLFVLIVIPTFLMGGTLPLLCSAMQVLGNNFTKSLSYLYGINTLGAMLGVLLSGFVMLGTIGEFNTVLTGIIINLLAGALIFTLVKLNTAPPNNASAESRNEAEAAAASYPADARKKILLAYAMVGFTSFALEIIWIRLFQLPLGTAIYSFSTVLTIYLLGSASGSYAFGKFFHNTKFPLRLLAMLMTGSSLFSLAGLFIYSRYVPWMNQPEIVVKPLKLFYTFLIVFPVTFMIGLMFPIVTRIYVREVSETGSGVGKLYSFNTLGCILGSLCCGFIFIPFIGTRNTLILLAFLNTAMAWWVLRSEKIKSASMAGKSAPVIIAAIITGFAFFLPDPYYSVVHKIMDWVPKEDLQVRIHKETATCTITAYGTSKDPMNKHLLINGVGMTSLVSETKLMAHLPLLLHYEDARDMLIICYGMGTCLRSAVTHKNLHADVAELVGEEYEINDFFHANGKEVLANPRVRHFTDDGRNFLLMHDKKYDVISIDPAPPVWSAGTVNLYTTEFFSLCKERLNKDGITCLWIPPAPATEVRMIMKSFLTVYPNTEMYRGPEYPGFYMIGYSGRSDLNPQRFAEAAADKDIMADINEWAPLAATPYDLLKLKMKTAPELSAYLQGVQEISDNHPYTEFPLWRKISDPNYSTILKSSHFY